MNKIAAKQLRNAAWSYAERFSYVDREFNFNKEKFSVESIIPLSDDTAWVVFLKSGGKKAGMFFYHTAMNGGTWLAFFPTDSHLLGMSELVRLGLKQSIEVYNLPLNEDEVQYAV